MTKKKGILKKLFEPKCFCCSKPLPKNASGTQHWVKTSNGAWKQSCLGCRKLFEGRTTKPMFNRGGWSH